MMTSERVTQITKGLAAYKEQVNSAEIDRLVECGEELLAEVKRLRAENKHLIRQLSEADEEIQRMQQELDEALR